jgi:hypothetical protein
MYKKFKNQYYNCYVDSPKFLKMERKILVDNL